MVQHVNMTPVMYSDITGYPRESFWNGVKEWFAEEKEELRISLSISYFGLSYLLPNGFAFAASATIGSMMSGLLLACVYVVAVAIVIYFIIKVVQYVYEVNTDLNIDYEMRY